MLERYTYQSALAASEMVHWRIEDIIGGEKRLDFAKPLMPDALAGVEQLAFLDGEEKRVLNQIRGNAYLNLRTRGGVYSSFRFGPCASAS